MKIEIGVTHEISINGDKAWVRLAITDEVEDEFTDEVFPKKKSNRLDDAINALSDKVNKKIIDVIEDAVKTVENYEVKK